MLDDAETLAGLEVAEIGGDRGRAHQRQAGLVGRQSGAVEVAAVERRGQHRQRLGTRRRGARQPVGLQGGGGRLLGEAARSASDDGSMASAAWARPIHRF